MKTKLLSIVVMCAAFLMSIQVNGQVLFEETFDYTTGDSIVPLDDDGTSPDETTGWYNSNFTRDPGDAIFSITDAPLSYAGYKFSGEGKAALMERDNGQEVQKPFSETITSGTFYLSFMLNASESRDGTSSKPNTGENFIRLYNEDNLGDQQLQFKVRSSSTANDQPVNFGLESDYGSGMYNLNETHLLVMKYTFAGTNGSVSDSATLFINPSLDTEPSDETAELKVASANNSSAISAIRLRCRQQGIEGIIGGICVARTWDELKVISADDNVEIASISADISSVSYEDLQFSLAEGSDDIYEAHDSIAYGSGAVTISASATALSANIAYTKQVVNPAVGESDTAVWVVTAEDGTTTKTYKAVVARSNYQSKAGFLSSGAGVKPEGWSLLGWTYSSSTKGNGGLFPGSSIIRLSDKDDEVPAALISPEFSQVGTLAFSARFSGSDDSESLSVQVSTNDGATWETTKTYLPTGGEIPAFAGESSADSFGRVSLSINKKNVMIRFQYNTPDDLVDDSQRTAIDDIAIKGIDYKEDYATAIASDRQQSANFKVYPNPASDYIHIEGNVAAVSIYNTTGQLLKQTSEISKISIKDLSSGIYFVKAGRDIKQFIVK